MINFRKIKVKGKSKSEAFESAPFEIIGEATTSYKRWLNDQGSDVTPEMITSFMVNYLNEKKCKAGHGYYITVTPVKENKKTNPYKIKNVKNKLGKRTYQTAYQVVDIDTDKILINVVGTKFDAVSILKYLYKNKGYTGRCKCIYTKQVTDGEPIAFRAEYSASANTHDGVYIVFGFENV